MIFNAVPLNKVSAVLRSADTGFPEDGMAIRNFILNGNSGNFKYHKVGRLAK